jgi:hypothetical protein
MAVLGPERRAKTAGSIMESLAYRSMDQVTGLVCRGYGLPEIVNRALGAGHCWAEYAGWEWPYRQNERQGAIVRQSRVGDARRDDE